MTRGHRTRAPEWHRSLRGVPRSFRSPTGSPGAWQPGQNKLSKFINSSLHKSSTASQSPDQKPHRGPFFCPPCAPFVGQHSVGRKYLRIELPQCLCLASLRRSGLFNIQGAAWNLGSVRSHQEEVRAPALFFMRSPQSGLGLLLISPHPHPHSSSSPL